MSYGTTPVRLEMETTEFGDFAVVAVRGEIDAYTAPTLRARLFDLHERAFRTLILDAGGIEFIDSSGLGVLIAAYKRSLRGGGYGLFVASPSERVSASLKITGLVQVFVVSESVEAAVTELLRRQELP